MSTVRIVVAVNIPADHEYLVDYGTADQAASFLDHVDGWLMDDDVTYELVEVTGPTIEPRLCGVCGCEVATEPHDADHHRRVGRPVTS